VHSFDVRFYFLQFGNICIRQNGSPFRVSTFGLAPLVANPIGGWLNDMISTRAVFWLGVVTLLLASALLMVAIGWKDIE